MRTDTAASHDVKHALGTLAAGVPYPAWKGGDGAPTYGAVVALWLDECERKGVTGPALEAAARAWLDAPFDGSRRDWPAPRDVLDLAPKGATHGLLDGCGLCSAEGFREVTIHREILNPIPGGPASECMEFAVHCDGHHGNGCARGAHWAQRRTEPLKGSSETEPRPKPPMLSAVVAAAWAKPRTLAVYVDGGVTQRLPAGIDAPKVWRGTAIPEPVRTILAAANDPRHAHVEGDRVRTARLKHAAAMATPGVPVRDEDRFEPNPEDDDGPLY